MEKNFNDFSYYFPTESVYFFPTVSIQNALYKDFISIIYPCSKPCKSQSFLIYNLEILF